MKKSKALWKFASAAILAEVHNKHRQWTWDYFRERRDDRHRYVELFKDRQLSGRIEVMLSEICSNYQNFSHIHHYSA